MKVPGEIHTIWMPAIVRSSPTFLAVDVEAAFSEAPDQLRGRISTIKNAMPVCRRRKEHSWAAFAVSKVFFLLMATYV